MARNIIKRRKEKFTANAGIIATMGMMRDAKYRLLAQNMPSARLGKSIGSRSFEIFFETRFRPDMQSDPSIL